MLLFNVKKDVSKHKCKGPILDAQHTLMVPSEDSTLRHSLTIMKIGWHEGDCDSSRKTLLQCSIRPLLMVKGIIKKKEKEL